MSPCAVIVGMPGTGKTTTGRWLARLLNVPFVDSDDLVETAAGCTVRELFADRGERAFRSAEFAAVSEALVSFPGVLSLGGGALTVPDTRGVIIASGVPVVLLRASLDTLARRVGDARRRPLLADDPPARLARLAAERGELYEQVSTLAVDTDDRSPGTVAMVIADRLAHTEGVRK